MQQQLKNLVAELAAVDAGTIHAGTLLSGGRLSGSIGRSVLDAGLRRKLNIKSQAVYSAATYGELEAAILGGSASAGEAATAPAVAPAARVFKSSASSPAYSSSNPASCGVDIESVSSLPATADYWEHDFYKTHFTPTEIAHCVLQESPRMHFAARWCAKEAVKKADPALFNEEFVNLELVNEASGAPVLYRVEQGGRGDGSSKVRLPHAVSISHTAETAVAFVVLVQPQQTVVAPAVQVASAAIPLPIEQKGGASGLPIALAFLAVVVSVVAVVIAVTRHA